MVELIGGTGAAKSLVLEAIAKGKHVVTANKALLAVHGNEIFAAAHAKGVMVGFEAAVAGGIPIIKALREGLTANRIEWVAGIVNGTTNFILSEMRDKGLDFATVLKEAQRLGYAEADPTFDIEGIDAAHKATIMCAIAFGVPMQFQRAHVEGITALQATDIRYAEQLGYRIKLIAMARRAAQGIELRVHPTLIPAKRLIANVEGAMNAVVVQGDAVGTTLYYGKGAGSEPTASAVVADLVDITRLHTADPDHRVPHLAFRPDALASTPILPMEEVVTAYYLRLRVADQTGVLSRITTILAEHDISIDAVLQRESAEGERQTDLIILTHDTREGRMNQAMAHDAGAAHGAGADRAHPQRRAELIGSHASGCAASLPPEGRSAVLGPDSADVAMRYISTRGDATPRAFSDILLEGLAPDGGLYLPERYPSVDADMLARWRALPYADLAFEILSLYIDDIPADDLRALCRKTYSHSVFGSDAITPLRALEPGLWIEGLSNGPTLAFKDMAMQLLGALFEYELARRGEHLNILGATSGDTGGAAEYAMRGKRGVQVFMLSPQGRMSPFQQAQMYSLQDANIHNIAIEGVFDDCQDIVKAVAGDLAFKRRHRIGSVNSINWARLVAQVVYYFAGYFQATQRQHRAGQLRGAVGQLRQRLRRPRGAHDGPADRSPDRRHQRERRARRVLPQRPLSRARGGRDARDVEPVDGHQQGVELRALRLRPAGARHRPHARAVRRAHRARRRLHARCGRATRAAPSSASCRAAARMPTAWRPSARSGSGTSDLDRPAHGRRREGRARVAASRRGDRRARNGAAGEVCRHHRRSHRHAAAAAVRAGGARAAAPALHRAAGRAPNASRR